MQVFATRKTPVLGGVLNQQLTSFTKIRMAVRIMKLIAILLLGGCLQLSARGIGQTITISVTDAPLEKVFQVIEKQTDFVFFVKTELLKTAKSVTLQVSNLPLQQVLDLCFKNQPLKYSINGKIITIAPRSSMVEGSSTGINQGKPGDIKGRILDANGEPVSGATVSVKGANKQTVTNANGEFTLSGIDDNAIVIVSHIQYETASLSLKGNSFLTATLQVKVNSLDEMQVIAYGTTTKRFNTGNVASVKASDIEKQPVNNPLLALQGRVAGVEITQANGIPGGSVKVQIRGQNSVRYGNDPLYVIDGVPYNAQLLPGLGSVLGTSSYSNYSSGNPIYGSPLSFINPNEIESIEILKDADATAIYGSRAANGVILITTKKGKQGQAKIEINGYTGWGKVAKKISMLNLREYLDMRYEAFKNDGIDINTLTPDDKNYDLTVWDTTQNTDWQKVLAGNTAKYNNIQTTISGGNNSIQYLVGATYFKQTSVFPGDFSDQKGSMHFNISSTPNKKLKFQFSGSYMVDKNSLLNEDLFNYIYYSPNAPSIFNNDGTLNWAPHGSSLATWDNPFSFMLRKFISNTNNLVSSGSISYQLFPELEIRSTFGYTNTQVNEISTYPILSLNPINATNAQAKASYSNNTSKSWIIEPQMTYNKKIAKGSFTLLVGSTFQSSNNQGYILDGQGFTSDAQLENPKAASSITVSTVNDAEYKYNGVFGRANFNWNNKYLLNFTGRRDGTSRFGPENRFHSFGAIGLGWIFSNEYLIRKSFPFISFGKIRGSYGTTGSDQIPNYKYLNLYTPSNVNYQGVRGLILSSLFNPTLAWEETNKLEAGIELGFFKDRLLVSGSYFRNRSSNQLAGYKLASTAGFASIDANQDLKVQNSGIELTFSSTNIKTKSFSWTSSFNLTFYENKLISVGPNAVGIGKESLGHSLNYTYVYHFMGVDPTTGVYQFEDNKGNATSNPDTFFVQGDLNPDYYGGIQNTISYKGFQMDVLFQFIKQIGQNNLFGNDPGGFSSGGSNQPKSVLDRWQTVGDEKKIQRFNQNGDYYSAFSNAIFSDASYSDASFIRLKNISVSYQVTDKLAKRVRVQGLRIYVQCQNLLTITKYKGPDPESRNLRSLPPLRVITTGVQVTF